MKKFISLLFCILCFGCQKETVNSAIPDGSYILTNAPEDAEITLEIKNNRFSGQSGLNRYFGDFEIKQDKIKVNLVGVTMMAGPENLMQAEQEYLADFQKTDSLTVEDTRLILNTENDKTLVYEKQ